MRLDIGLIPEAESVSMNIDERVLVQPGSEVFKRKSPELTLKGCDDQKVKVMNLKGKDSSVSSSAEDVQQHCLVQ